MMQLEASAAFDETQQRRMDAMHVPQGPSQAGISPVMPGRAPSPEMRTQAPPPEDHGAPDIPSPIGTPRSLGAYLSETGKNIPGSVGAMGRDMWHAATNPIQTLEGMGSAAVGGIQHAKDAVGIPTLNTFGDQREAGSAAGQYLQRYHPDNLTDTFRRDPAGVALDVGGLAAGGGGAGARAATMGAKFGRHIADIDAPPPKTRTQVPTDREFIKGAPSKEGLRKHGSMLYKAADDAGVRFEGPAYTEFVDRLSD